MHWRNSRFQIAYFLAGKCHTADEAYRMLCELREERWLALETARAGDLRNEAVMLEIAEKMADESPTVRLRAQADLIETQALQTQGKACVAEAERELAFIEQLIDLVQPLRQFKDLPDHEAHQMAQWQEWKLELITRAQNYLLTTGTIPPDHYNAMRLHPAFEDEIAPAIGEMQRLRGEGRISLMLPPPFPDTFKRQVEQLLQAPEVPQLSAV